MRWMPLALAAALLAGCGTNEDERPATLEVVTLTVLAPSCGQVQCHSTSTRTEDLAFDTVDDSNDALVELEVDRAIADNRPLENDFWNVLIGEETRMPPDSPLADEDLALIKKWLEAGATGLQP